MIRRELQKAFHHEGAIKFDFNHTTDNDNKNLADNYKSEKYGFRNSVLSYSYLHIIDAAKVNFERC